MDFRDITEEENVPCRYELSWQEDPPAIILRIHEDFIKGFKPKHPPEEWPIVIMFQEDFEFKGFSADFDGDIGFKRVFKRTREKDGFIEYTAKIPIIRKLINEPCPACEGSGIDKIRDEDPCLLCKGIGRKQVMDWNTADAISVSLSVFTEILNLPAKNTSSRLPQLLILDEVSTTEGAGGRLINARITIPFYEYLKNSNREENASIMTRSMMRAYCKMLNIRSCEKFYFNAEIFKNGTFFAQCPGNACGISTFPCENGLGITSNNVDTQIQQIMLVGALAALCDRARKEMKI